jgi:hypothetical protein
MAGPAGSGIKEAAREQAQRIAGQDALFAPWAGASVGEPVLVRTVAGAPSYWLVPVELHSRAIGFVRVTTEGKAVASGAFYREPDRLDDAPRVVTGITAAEAQEVASAAAGPDAVLDEPVFVHDGPPGREAWLVRTQQPDGQSRSLFVTAAGWYER